MFTPIFVSPKGVYSGYILFRYLMRVFLITSVHECMQDSILYYSFDIGDVYSHFLSPKGVFAGYFLFWSLMRVVVITSVHECMQDFILYSEFELGDVYSHVLSPKKVVDPPPPQLSTQPDTIRPNLQAKTQLQSLPVMLRMHAHRMHPYHW
jgi:hypothetical protein